MNKPYIICHMMTSVDGRIDCAMTEHLPGVSEYYATLDAPSRVSGRITAQLERRSRGHFPARQPHPSERRHIPRRRTPTAMRSLRIPTAHRSGTEFSLNGRC